MKKMVKVIISIVIGIFMIPAVYMLGITLFGTILAFLANPKAVMIVLGIFAVISLPGVFIASLIRR